MAAAGALTWRSAVSTDVAAIDRIARVAHPDYPERPEAFAEKLMLSPTTSFVAVDTSDSVRGYAIAYPWHAGDMPKIDTLFGKLPEDASVLYVHDIALLPSARRQGLVTELLKLLSAAARRLGLSEMTLAAVYGTEAAWFRYGFHRADMTEKLKRQVAPLGPAVFMTRPLDPV
jgi:ribosomal protein S18 acetylase RimI-like enzyme